MMRYLLRALPAIGYAALATSASAAFMSFNDLPNGLSAGPAYVESGLKLRSEQGQFYTSAGVLVGGPIEAQGQYFNFTLANGQAFMPKSVNLVRLTRDNRIFGNFSLAGYNETDDWISSLDFDNSSDRTVDLSALGKVYRLRLTFYNDLGGVDNLVFQPTIDAGIPEPSSWAMLLFGFAATGCAMRNRRRAAVAPAKA